MSLPAPKREHCLHLLVVFWESVCKPIVHLLTEECVSWLAWWLTLKMRWLHRYIYIVMIPAVQSNEAACLYACVCQMIWYIWCWHMVQQASVFHSKPLFLFILSQSKPLHPFVVLHSLCCILSWPLQHAEVCKRQGTDLQPCLVRSMAGLRHTTILPVNKSVDKNKNGMPLYKLEECGFLCVSQG